MAKVLIIENDRKEIDELLIRAYQSGNINFLLGSGASMPALSVSGPIESDINKLLKEGHEKEANEKLYQFLLGFAHVNNALLDSSDLSKLDSETPKAFTDRSNAFKATKENYKRFLSNIEFILDRRKTSLLRKQANIFTTNYDLFVEEVAQGFPSFKLNDGFVRTPNLRNQFAFSTQSFFNSISNSGNLYNYKVEIPCVSLIKIHGSLSWKRRNDEIFFEPSRIDAPAGTPTDQQIKAFNDQFALILPQQGKFRETLLDRWYYELLRIYSNELDKEGTLLVTFGFSFCDDHIHEITKRALKNPTLLLIVFAFSAKSAKEFESRFVGYNNVIIIKRDEAGTIPFDDFNNIISESLKIGKEASDAN